LIGSAALAFIEPETEGTSQIAQQLSHTSVARLRDWNFIVNASPIRSAGPLVVIIALKSGSELPASVKGCSQ
jgi:hypothetical protein